MEKVTDRRGYLKNDYMLFHLSDKKNEEHTFHYHEFDKIVVLLSGRASYIIEGREYFLTPGDILLVNRHDIHMPVIDKSEDYNRIVIWINRDCIERFGSKEADLTLAFRVTREKNCSLLRVPEELRPVMEKALFELEKSISDTEFGSQLISDALMTRYLTLINRIAIRDISVDIAEYCRYDEKISEIMQYINSNLASDLTLDALAARFYISRSYLMHRFKEETGYTLHSYILEKRLLNSKMLLTDGEPVTEAAFKSGFNEYSTYLRAFKKMFGCLPKDY